MAKRIAVVGNGIIGHGIAEIFAAGGWDVTLVGRNGASLAAAMGKIEASLREFAAEGLRTAADVPAALARIRTTTELDDSRSAGLVIEAVPEDMDLKRRIFGRLDEICAADAILASSSGHLASELQGGLKRPERVIATHFWYPPQLIPLVEICAGPQTAPGLADRVAGIIREVGKEPVVIDKEIEGFIGNRIQFAALREAWSLWAAGVASAAAIDAVVRNSIGRRLAVTGPIESADVGGLETLFHFAEFLQPTLDARPNPPAEVGKLVADGHRGLANGKGVYDWSKRDGAGLVARRRAELFRWLKQDRAQRGK